MCLHQVCCITQQFIDWKFCFVFLNLNQPQKQLLIPKKNRIGMSNARLGSESLRFLGSWRTNSTLRTCPQFCSAWGKSNFNVSFGKSKSRFLKLWSCDFFVISNNPFKCGVGQDLSLFSVTSVPLWWDPFLFNRDVTLVAIPNGSWKMSPSFTYVFKKLMK